jgi:acyl carrier protein
MNENAIYDFLKSAFVDIFGRTDIVITPSLSAKDVVGWDSFRQVEIIMALEEKFDIRIRARELNDVATLGDLVGLVTQKLPH